MKKIIYLAGPLFTQAERFWNKILAELLRKKGGELEIFLPKIKLIMCKIFMRFLIFVSKVLIQAILY